MALTNYQKALNDAIWVDINSRFTVNNLPDRLPDAQAVISSSLFNLFNCAPGERSRIFQPEYGSIWRQFIHEPITDHTASKMQIFMIDAIRKWEPRITLDMKNTWIIADTSIPGFVVRIAFSIPGLSAPQSVAFSVSP